MTRSTAVLAPGVAALVVVAGCGSSQPKPTKAQYVARGNAVCAGVSRSVKALAGQGLPLEVLAPQVLAVRQKANARLRSIPLPADSKVPTEWLHLREVALDDAKKIFQTKPGSPAYRAANLRYRKAEAQVTDVALRYGFGECVGVASN